MRDTTPAFASALSAQDVAPVVLFEGEFATGVLRLWTGFGTVRWNGEDWTGAGTLLGFGDIEETSDVVSKGMRISLSGVPTDVVAAAIDDARQGLPGRLWLGLLNASGGIIANPVQAFTGRLDVPEITDDANTCTVSISYESRLVDLNRPRAWRYTHESQQALHPGDLGFEYVTAIQDQEIKWGRG